MWVRHCEICSHAPERSEWKIRGKLCCHEISNGPLRQKSLDKAYAILVLCGDCNEDEVEDKAKWPQARQLAVLKKSRPDDYDLAAFNALVGYGPDRITESDVDIYSRQNYDKRHADNP